MKTIQIKCSAQTTLPIDLILEFQGPLKKLSAANLNKLKANILKLGFIAPFFVWDNKGDNMLLDGHQRLAALISLRQDGYDIPLLPVDYINAKDEAEARAKLQDSINKEAEELGIMAPQLDLAPPPKEESTVARSNDGTSAFIKRPWSFEVQEDD